MSKVKKVKKVPLVLFLDIETNGLPLRKHNGLNSYYDPSETDKYDSCRMIAVAWAVYDFKGNKRLSRNYLVKHDGVNVPNSEIHHITEESINENGVSVNEVFEQLESDLNGVRVIVAHNLEFDFNILLSEVYRLGNKDTLKNKLLGLEKSCTGEQTKDLLKIPLKSSYVISKYKMPKLTELYQYCFKKEMPNHHDPESDVLHLSECFFYLLKK